MILGAITVTLTYVLINVALMRLLGLEAMAASKKVASDALSTVHPAGGTIIAVIVCISTFGTALIYMLSAPRIYFAMAEDGLFFESLARVHPRFHTPVAAVALQSGWAICLILLWKTFEEVITYVTFTDWIFFTLAACLVFFFRKQRPDAERPYRTFGYPLTPIFFVVVSSLFILNTLIEKPVQALWASLLLLSGLPFYFYFKRRAAA